MANKEYWSGVWQRLKNCWAACLTGVCFIVYVFTNVYVGEEVINLVSLLATVVVGIIAIIKQFKSGDVQPPEQK